MVSTLGAIIKLDSNKLADDIVDKVKDALKLGSSSVIGVDVGLSAIKVAEITKLKTGQIKLTKFGIAPLSEGSIIEDEIQKMDEMAGLIANAFQALKIKNKNVAVGLSGPNTLARKLQLAGGTFEEIEDQVMWESEQYIPFGVDNAYVSFHIMGENEGGGVDVFIGAARVDIVDAFKELMSKAGLRLKILDLNLAACVNIFEHVFEEEVADPTKSFIVIDFGAQTTQFVIYKSNQVVFSKEISIGGVMITEEIQRQMGVTYEEAEDLKSNVDENGNLPEEVLQIMDDVVDIFFQEIKKTHDFYMKASSDETEQHCILTGGSCLIPGLQEGIEELLGIPSKILNPFEKILYNEKTIPEEMLAPIAYRGAVAIGLAMRELNR